MSENNRPDSEQKKDQTTAEDILAQRIWKIRQ